MANYLPPQLSARGPAPWVSTLPPSRRVSPSFFPPVRSGSSMNFDRGWSGDRENRGGPLTDLGGFISSNLPREVFYIGTAQRLSQGLQDVKAAETRIAEDLERPEGFRLPSPAAVRGKDPLSKGGTPDSSSVIGPGRPSMIDHDTPSVRAPGRRAKAGMDPRAKEWNKTTTLPSNAMGGLFSKTPSS